VVVRVADQPINRIAELLPLNLVPDSSLVWLHAAQTTKSFVKSEVSLRLPNLGDRLILIDFFPLAMLLDFGEHRRHEHG